MLSRQRLYRRAQIGIIQPHARPLDFRNGPRPAHALRKDAPQHPNFAPGVATFAMRRPSQHHVRTNRAQSALWYLFGQGLFRFRASSSGAFSLRASDTCGPPNRAVHWQNAATLVAEREKRPGSWGVSFWHFRYVLVFREPSGWDDPLPMMASAHEIRQVEHGFCLPSHWHDRCVCVLGIGSQHWVCSSANDSGLSGFPNCDHAFCASGTHGLHHPRTSNSYGYKWRHCSAWWCVRCAFR